MLLDERLENLDGCLRPAGASVRSTQYQAGVGMAGEHV